MCPRNSAEREGVRRSASGRRRDWRGTDTFHRIHWVRVLFFDLVYDETQKARLPCVRIFSKEGNNSLF
jgi:hypothetical protein